MLIELMLLMVHDASILCPAKEMQGVINFFGWICILINQNTQAFHIFMTALLQNIIHIVREGRKSDAVNGVISVDGMVVKYDAEMEKKEEKDACRIYRNQGDAKNPLRYPCREEEDVCSGSNKFVHLDCLLQWLSRSNARQCEILDEAVSKCIRYGTNFRAFVYKHHCRNCWDIFETIVSKVKLLQLLMRMLNQLGRVCD